MGKGRGEALVAVHDQRPDADALILNDAASSDTDDETAQQEAEAALPYDRYFEWNANINGIIIQLRTNVPHLYDFWMENWYPAQLEADIEPHGVIYAVDGVLYYEYSALLLRRDTIEVGSLPAGEVSIAMEMRTPMERAAPAELKFWINGKEAAEGTVRRLYAESKGRNAIHASDSDENAAREIGFFFPERSIFSK